MLSDAICVVYGEWVNLVIVGAWHVVLRTSLLDRQRYVVLSLSLSLFLTNVLVVSRFG